MLNRNARSWMIGCWTATGVGIAGLSVAFGASAVTTSILLGLTVAGALVNAVVAQGAPPPTVAEILYATDSSDSAR